ncbi:IucA/IucC family protein [Marinicrinis sediminis]|uniref:IucA/IucC family protein n=1 Tax=Marinicrinis sediminis TaxID=1652465 RepID=A0ABW5RBG6_9BACL
MQQKSHPSKFWMVQQAVQSEEYQAVKQRVWRQWLESMLYEQVVVPEETHVTQDRVRYRLRGKDECGNQVTYEAVGRKRFSYDRVRLDRAPVVRENECGIRTEVPLRQAISELLRAVIENGLADANGIDLARVQPFSNELMQTLLHDAIDQHEQKRASDGPYHMPDLSMDEMDVDHWERKMTEGHPYHPAYKSRIGFNYLDHLTYGPEQSEPFSLLWLAVSRKVGWSVIDEGMDEGDWLKTELGDACLDRFHKMLQEQGEDADDYLFMPVHPWQWLHDVAPGYVEELAAGFIRPLDVAPDLYRPQQSIRTLSNVSHPSKPYVKLSLNMVNTSCSRHIDPLFIELAPRVSRWLQDTVQADPFLQQEKQLVLLGEFAGACCPLPAYNKQEDAARQGMLGCLWRESLAGYLKPGEKAIPFNALYRRDSEGMPMLDRWMQRYGVKEWLERMLDACVIPVVHLLVAHGIALETHGQNMILIHQDGLPLRVALKDFHEDVLFCRNSLADPSSCPAFPAEAGYEVDQPSEVTQLTLGALFFINVSELALMLGETGQLDEWSFWELVVQVLERYEARFPELALRRAQFDLFMPRQRVEKLMLRRLAVRERACKHWVSNPLYEARKQQDRKMTVQNDERSLVHES